METAVAEVIGSIEKTGRKAVSKKYNWRIEEQKLLGVYGGLAKGAGIKGN